MQYRKNAIICFQKYLSAVFRGWWFVSGATEFRINYRRNIGLILERTLGRIRNKIQKLRQFMTFEMNLYLLRIYFVLVIIKVYNLVLKTKTRK